MRQLGRLPELVFAFAQNFRGGFRPLPGLGQLRGSFFHQFLEMVAVIVQFFSELFLFGDIFLHCDIMGDRAFGLA